MSSPYDGLIELPDETLAATEVLQAADRRTIKTIFQRLPAPRVEDVEGEYDACLLSQGNRSGQWLIAALFGMYGNWRGKAFRPVDATSGFGYNCFENQGSIEAKLWMRTRLDKSKLYEGDSLFIEYAHDNRGPVCLLVGELRQLRPDIILGIGAIGPKVGRRDLWRRKIPFALYGPVRDYQYERDLRVSRNAA